MATTHIPSNVDVAIVGGGPAGLTTAITLLQSGVKTIVLDAAPAPNPASRATVIHSRTLEVMEDLSLVDEIQAAGKQADQWFIRSGNSVLANLSFKEVPGKYNYFVTIPQVKTEELLQARVEALGGSVFRGAKVADVVDSGDKVKLEVGLQDTKATIEAAYVVAADGLHSTIREALGIEFKGGEYKESFVTADMHLSSLGGLNEALHLYLHTSGFVLLIPEPNDIWRIVATVAEAPKVQDAAFYQKLVDERTIPGIEVKDLTWYSRFHIHHRLAAGYRKGRVFLAGDAAHVHSPAGGQGMNTGIQDGYRLGQILSEAIRDGKTDPASLDRYHKERRPEAQGVVKMTHNITSSAAITSPILAFVRNWMIWLLMNFAFARQYLTVRLAELEHF
ncbi:hypothetical protein LTR78_008626 [Recurvomyces mirabilis]|uniref:FAD-binding domain-containing protein n=1 Tax=Recurvomyces mirabilis TaxID=574656 RepID=A0AAE0TPU7_9PEZI|nr:hypothetical protein LTR78_008626 [Recurvomyces mirabilis]KAK5153463.1 hypothetical protein LTS14_007633 [Recurvomyces mirabilis]